MSDSSKSIYVLFCKCGKDITTQDPGSTKTCPHCGVQCDVDWGALIREQNGKERVS